MDHRGHIKKPLERADLPLGALVDSFIVDTKEEEPTLAKHLTALDDDHHGELAGVLGRFDTKGQGALDPNQRLLARRVLTRLHRHNMESLTLTNKILDYMDVNNNAIIEENELELCVEIMELFSKADSYNDTLSPKELKMLYTTLRQIDTNDNGRLDSHERDQLHTGLKDPQAFLAYQKARSI